MIKVLLGFVVLFAVSAASAQTDLDRMVETERSFAAMAAEKGTKAAFLANLADDGVLFQPDRVNGKEYWTKQSESRGLLSWAPNFADIAANGMIGYTTGNWRYFAHGKPDRAVSFGEYVTIWQKMPDGQYKIAVDIGISHDQPPSFSKDLSPPVDLPAKDVKASSAADSANRFFETVGRFGLAEGYKEFAAKNVRGYRDGSFPILGRGKLTSYVRKTNAEYRLAKRMVFFGSADVAYVLNTYTEFKKGGSQTNGNFLQVWKFIDGRWQIVLDLFSPLPAK